MSSAVDFSLAHITELAVLNVETTIEFRVVDGPVLMSKDIFVRDLYNSLSLRSRNTPLG